MAAFTLPWISNLLEPVKSDYKRSPPNFQHETVNSDDLQYLLNVSGQTDDFDRLGLKSDFYDRLQTNKATVEKTVCQHGEILLVKFKEDSYTPPWKTWWRAIRLLSPKPVRVAIFAHPQKRLPPTHGKPLAGEHVNGGMTMRCDAKTIIVYRKEEATRVLIHELFHANCSDPYNLDTPFLEADTEAWAELVLCAMAAKGNASEFKSLLSKQIQYALKQATSAEKYHDVEDDTDYAWRYLSGRLDVWKRLGIVFDESKESREKIKSLRFTTCEPENV